MLSQILKHTADYQFSMQPYDGAFMERMPEEWKQNKGLYPVSLLRNYIEKSGRRWVDTMMNDYSMRLAEASPGKRFITAVVPVLELRKMIQKVESMQQNPRKRSIRIMDFLQKCPTDKVALIILLRKEETPLEEMPSLRPMKESLRVGLDRGIISTATAPAAAPIPAVTAHPLILMAFPPFMQTAFLVCPIKKIKNWKVFVFSGKKKCDMIIKTFRKRGSGQCRLTGCRKRSGKRKMS